MQKIFELPKSLASIVILCLFFVIGCDSNSNNGNSNNNFCYLESASNPCFDPNQDGSTTIVTDQTVEEVIENEENMEGFQGQLPLENIFNAYVIALQPPNCPFEQSELVIKTNADWNRFRNSCFFSAQNLPDVDFSEDMVLVSIHEFGQLDTTLSAVLEFVDDLVAIIQDDNLPPPSPGHAIDIVSIPSRDVPVDFIRVENDIL